MERSHCIDLGGLLAGGRLMAVEDEVLVEAFEGLRFPKPAAVRLALSYADRVLRIDGSVDVRVQGECDRCLEAVERAVHVDVDERIDPFANAEADPFGESNVVSGGRLDVADLATQCVLSALPLGLLCGQDCRGLCGTCGSNKNLGRCSCEVE